MNSKIDVPELLSHKAGILYLLNFQLGDPFCFPEELTHVDGTVERFPLHKSDNIPYFFPNSAGLVYEAIEVARCIREG